MGGVYLFFNKTHLIMKMKSTIPWLLMALFSLFIVIEGQAQNAKKEIKLPAGIEKVTTVEGITEYQMKDNV